MNAHRQGAPALASAIGGSFRPPEADSAGAVTASQDSGSADDHYLRLVGVGKQYDPNQPWATRNISFSVRRGEIFGLLGPSGCGKTTTLNTLAGFVQPTEGSIEVDGRDVTHQPPNKRDVAMVFQDYALFPHMTVSQNVAFGPRLRKWPKAETEREVADLLGLVGLAKKSSHYPRQLSGGQQQRVAIARALAVKPRVVLLDEPLSNLDAKLRAEMRRELKRILGGLGTTVVLVTHDQSEAFSVCDRVALMLEGRVEAIATPRELYRSPTSREAAEFIGEGSFVPCRVEESSSQRGFATVRLTGHDGASATATVRTNHPVTDGEPGAVLIRPEWLVDHTAGVSDESVITFRGRITDEVFSGEVVSYVAATDFGDLAIRRFESEAIYRVGDQVTLACRFADAVFVR